MDSDGDGLWDDWEIALGTNLLNPDSDGDGFADGIEVARSYDPRSAGGEKMKKRIAVDLSEQKLRYYLGDIKLDEFSISSGKKSTPTPVGEFSVLKKRPTVHYAGATYDYPNTKWNLMFKPGNGLNYYIHGAWWHNDFGKTRSAGCVNVPHVQEYMGRLYDWADTSTPVSIHT
jgi:lipoprotein-anchoring transpeptidase ErfK/SrfK